MHHAAKLERELAAAKRAAADRAAVASEEAGRAAAASQEAARQKAILEEEVRFWKIEALRVASEHDSIHQHLERLVHRRPAGASLPTSAPSFGIAAAGGREARGAESGQRGGEVTSVTAEPSLRFGPVGAGFIKDAQTRALLDSRAPLQEASRQVTSCILLMAEAVRLSCSAAATCLCDAISMIATDAAARRRWVLPRRCSQRSCSWFVHRYRALKCVLRPFLVACPFPAMVPRVRGRLHPTGTSGSTRATAQARRCQTSWPRLK